MTIYTSGIVKKPSSGPRRQYLAARPLHGSQDLAQSLADIEPSSGLTAYLDGVGRLLVPYTITLQGHNGFSAIGEAVDTARRQIGVGFDHEMPIAVAGVENKRTQQRTLVVARLIIANKTSGEIPQIAQEIHRVNGNLIGRSRYNATHTFNDGRPPKTSVIVARARDEDQGQHVIDAFERWFGITPTKDSPSCLKLGKLSVYGTHRPERP